jgi:hypothetical protein
MTYSILAQSENRSRRQNCLVHEVQIVRQEHQWDKTPINLAQDALREGLFILIDVDWFRRDLRGRSVGLFRIVHGEMLGSDFGRWWRTVECVFSII